MEDQEQPEPHESSGGSSKRHSISHSTRWVRLLASAPMRTPATLRQGLKPSQRYTSYISSIAPALSVNALKHSCTWIEGLRVRMEVGNHLPP